MHQRAQRGQLVGLRDRGRDRLGVGDVGGGEPRLAPELLGQLPYASAKAGIVGLTLVAARDLASKQIRVVTIAPGTFDTPILARLPENVRDSLGQMVPHPRRLGVPDEFARLALAVGDNPMLNGETIRLGGAIRMQPK